MASSDRPALLRGQVLDASQLRAVLDAWEEGMQVISPSWHYVYVNDAAARHGRRTREELYGRSMLECYPGVEATPLFAALQRCMLERSSALMLNEVEFSDGSKAWFELRIKPCIEGLVVLSLPRDAGESDAHRRRRRYAHVRSGSRRYSRRRGLRARGRSVSAGVARGADSRCNLDS